MKYSLLFGKTRKSISQDAVSVNHKLLSMAGFVEQVSAGVYTYLPLGFRVLTRVEQIVREEMNSIGCQEILMPALIEKRLWEKTGRWEGVDVLFKTKSQTEKEYGLGFSQEEVVSPLASQFIHSYKDLPVCLYHIQTKFRDELRAKSGVLRGREFGMKDAYSFHADRKDFELFYEIMKKAYFAAFARMGLDEIKLTEASGGSFTKKHSHEFNVLTPFGEIDLLYCSSCSHALNVEISLVKAGESCPSCGKGTMKEGKAIEVGNIFDLGDKFSKACEVTFMDKDGKVQTPVMGCYGIGTTRLVGAIAELSHDDKGLIWPREVAPYPIHLITLPGAEVEGKKIYEEFCEKGLEPLWDDRDSVNAGTKFSDADAIGIPWRFVVSKKTDGKIEIKKRDEEETKLVTRQEALNIFI
jgi:prolyl-tRNA synthetase